MITEYYNANQAAADVNEARNLNGDYKKQETIAILAIIESYALQGINTKSFDNIEDIIISRLINLGFNCRKYPSSLCEPPYYEISW